MSAPGFPPPDSGGHELVEVVVDVARPALEEAFSGVGMLSAEAQRVADALLDAERCEVPTHGLLRVPWYLQAIRSGTITVGRATHHRTSALGVAMLDGHGSYGYLPTWLAVDEAIAGAAAGGIGLAGVRNVAEFGRAAYYAAEAARRGHVAIVCQNTLPLLAAPGSDRMTHGNNPLSYSAPGADAPVFDAAFTTRSGGELRRRAVLGLPLPAESGVRRRGRRHRRRIRTSRRRRCNRRSAAPRGSASPSSSTSSPGCSPARRAAWTWHRGNPWSGRW